MQRAPMLATFRERLHEVVRASGLNQSQFAETTQIDRSTLSQLLLPTNRRLPRAETLAAIADRHQVSIDWLLGLSNAGPMQAEMIREQASFAFDALAPNDERLIAWFAEADGYKIRYVPSSLPDMLKTEPVFHHELDRYVASRPEQKIETAAARLAWTREPGSDMEVCSSVQSLVGFTRGEGIWSEVSLPERRAQLAHIARLTEELYPRLRWFLFDGLQRYAVPVTIFGPKRAALYLGQMYMVLTSAEHVRTLTGHFDDLIRGATVQPPDVPRFTRQLLAELR
jgi:transcriptional regulator with XRE-family HTH domain